jgi:hypothetical protein
MRFNKILNNFTTNLRQNFLGKFLFLRDDSLFFQTTILYLLFLDLLSDSRPQSRVLFVFLLTIISMLMTYRRITGPSLKLLYFVSLSFGFYFILQSPIFSTSYFYFEVLYFSIKLLIIIFIIIAIRKGYLTTIALVLLTLFYSDFVYVIKPLTQNVTKSSTEYLSIWESVVALYACIIFLQLYSLILKIRLNYSNFNQTLIILFLAGHLANYFGGFYPKIILDGGFFSWLQNETFASLRRADLFGLNVWTSLLEYDLIHLLEPIGNHLTFWSQFASTFVILMPILIAPLTIFYDFFHIGVGLLAGPWFYKWIFVNLLILANCSYIIKILKNFSWLKILIAQSLVPLIFFIGSITPLGWYEYRQGALIYAYGVDKNGNTERLHPQFFGPHAFAILQKRTHYAFPSGLPMQMGGRSFSELEASRTCSRREIKSPSLNYHKKLLRSVTQNILEERSSFSKVMMHLQPYHIIIPSDKFVNYSFNKNYKAIRYDLVHICINENYEIIEHYIRDTLTVKKTKN